MRGFERHRVDFLSMRNFCSLAKEVECDGTIFNPLKVTAGNRISTEIWYRQNKSTKIGGHLAVWCPLGMTFGITLWKGVVCKLTRSNLYGEFLPKHINEDSCSGKNVRCYVDLVTFIILTFLTIDLQEILFVCWHFFRGSLPLKVRNYF